MQMILNLLQQPYCTLFRIELFSLLQAIHLILLHVELREFKELLFFTPLRYGERHIIQLHIQFKGYDNLTRKTLIPLSHLNDA